MNMMVHGRDCKVGDQKEHCHGGLFSSTLDRRYQFKSFAVRSNCNYCPAFHEFNQKNAFIIPENGSRHFSRYVRRLLDFFSVLVKLNSVTALTFVSRLFTSP